MNNRRILTVQLAIVFILVALVSCEVIILHSEWFGGEQQDIATAR
jgi:hypothetical protein